MEDMQKEARPCSYTCIGSNGVAVAVGLRRANVTDFNLRCRDLASASITGDNGSADTLTGPTPYVLGSVWVKT